jgi:predicted metal-dependent phosphoesterase TrpH
LHSHTTCSDGVLSPEELVERARDKGLRWLAITDHDTTFAFAAARAHAKKLGLDLEIIPGIELTLGVGQGEVHMLGFFVDPDHAELNEVTLAIRQDRHRRYRLMLEQLVAAGLEIDVEAVLAETRHAPTRAHLSRYLIKNRHCADIRDAFERLIGEGCVGYVPKVLVPAEEGVPLLHRAGGVAVLAHPGRYHVPPDLERLVACGIDGLEVHYPSHGRETTESLLAFAEQHGLLVTGGSDFHDPNARTDLGRQPVPAGMLDRLRAAARRRSEAM